MKDLYTGGILIAIITAVFYSIKGIATKLFNRIKDRFISQVVVYDYDELFYVIEGYLSKNHAKQYRNVEASYEKARRWFDNGPTREQAVKGKMVNYKQEPTCFSIKYKGTRLYFIKEKKTLEHAQDLKSAINLHFTIYCVNNMSALKGFLQDITDIYNQEHLATDKIGIYVSDSSGSWSLTNRKRVKSLDKVILDEKVKKDLVADLNNFKNMQQWYLNVSVAYKRGYLFYGPPGTGKTTLAQAVASYLKKDIAFINLNSIQSDSQLINVFAHIPENSVLLIEDIDCVFHGRNPVSTVNKITFSCLLNCLDGVLSQDGMVTILTTNHIEKLDDALIRAGRADVSIEIPLAGNKEANEYMSLFYNRPVRLTRDVLVPMSKVQEVCLKNKDNVYRSMIEIAGIEEK
jgi:AAA+ superfamily predicted ATPase